MLPNIICFYANRFKWQEINLNHTPSLSGAKWKTDSQVWWRFHCSSTHCWTVTLKQWFTCHPTQKIITFLDFGLYFGRWCCISRHQDAIFHSRNSLLMLQTDLFVHRMALYWTLPSYCSSSAAHLSQIKNRTVPTFMDSDTKWRNLHKVKEFKLDKGGLHDSGAPCLLKPVLIH